MTSEEVEMIAIALRDKVFEHSKEIAFLNENILFMSHMLATFRERIIALESLTDETCEKT